MEPAWETGPGGSVELTKATSSVLAPVAPAVLYKADISVCVCALLSNCFNVAVKPFHSKMLRIKSACLMKSLIIEIPLFKEVDDLCNLTKC